MTGWSIGSATSNQNPAQRTLPDVESLHDKMEYNVLPLYYRERERFIDVMRHCIALNGSSFNPQRMLLQYVLNAYFE